MRKHNQIHTLGTPHYKAHFRFLRKLKDFKYALWFEKYGSWPTAHAKTCEQVLRHRAVYGDSCGVVWILHTAWYSRKAAHPKEEYREIALMNQRRSSNLGFRNLAKLQNSSVDFLSKRQCGFMLKSDIKNCFSTTDPFFQARCATAVRWMEMQQSMEGVIET